MIAILAFGGVAALVVVAIFVAACALVGLVIDDGLGSIGRGRRRAPDVPYWSIR